VGILGLIFEEFREVATTFQSSTNPNIRKIVEELLKIDEYGKVLLQQYYDFSLSPKNFIASKTGLIKWTEYKSLIKEQYDYVTELLEEISKEELSKPQALTEKKEISEKVEFQYSEEELKAIGSWSDKTMTELMLDVNKGNAAALYMVGLSHLYGKGGFPINIQQANNYFSISALLGFAPGMDKMKSMYLEDDPNPFLALVYVNLVASFGHSEFTTVYHDQRRRLVEECGNSIANEIDRIATEKTIKIYKAMNQISESKDKVETTINFFIERGIAGEDVEFSVEYWEKFFNKDAGVHL
jgi:TPR repeat protein